MSTGKTETTQPPVEYRRLGNSGLRVSVPILGAMSFGSSKWLPWVINEDEALPLLKAAWDRGVTTIDTANVYSNGYSERIIGKFLKQYQIPRHRVLIFTKCYSLVHEDPGTRTILYPELKNTRDYVNQSGLSRGAIFNQVEDSLERLGTSYIDLLQVCACLLAKNALQGRRSSLFITSRNRHGTAESLIDFAATVDRRCGTR